MNDFITKYCTQLLWSGLGLVAPSFGDGPLVAHPADGLAQVFRLQGTCVTLLVHYVQCCNRNSREI